MLSGCLIWAENVAMLELCIRQREFSETAVDIDWRMQNSQEGNYDNTWLFLNRIFTDFSFPVFEILMFLLLLWRKLDR